MKDTVKFLTQIQPPRSHNSIDSLNRVAEYIRNRFEAIGLSVSYQEFEADGNIYKNVIATLNPHYEKRVLFGGHYDVCGEIPGADDNASAVAGIIESARQLYARKDEIPFRIDFVAYVLEEPPYFETPQMGSYIHAHSLKEENAKIIGLINYEMIGYFSDEPGSQEYPLAELEAMYPDTGNFITVVANEGSQEFLGALDLPYKKESMPVFPMVLPEGMDSIAASDQINYWDLGYPAVMVSDTAQYRNKNYHTVNDTMETLDFERMQWVVDMMVESVAGMGA